MLRSALLVFLLFWRNFAHAKEHIFDFNVTYGTKNIDTHNDKQVILINDEWPLPLLRISKGDTILLTIHNFLKDESISIHFHGIFQSGTTQMDGASMISQCGVSYGDSFLYNFTVDQLGTYWYHSHSSGQYGDGLRGMLLVDDPQPPFEYDYDVPLSVSDWYYNTSKELAATDWFIQRASEPIVDAVLFNETVNGVWKIELGKTYYLRIANIGMSLPQYLYLENHTMTIVEIDGVYTDPVEVESIYIVSGQRYGVLVKAKPFLATMENFRFVQILQRMMSTIPAVNWLVYDETKKFGLEANEMLPPIKSRRELNYPNEIDLIPLYKVPLYVKLDKQIYLEFHKEDGHYSFNSLPYAPPQIPTLYSVISSPNETIASESLEIYGNSSNSYIIEKGEIVEIVVDSTHDMMKHPFHLHGHNFQVLYHGKSADLSDIEIPQYPMIRDTVNLNGRSKVVIRFKADNPGVWIFHCHIDWHLIQGLAITLVEDPGYVREHVQVSENHYNVCRKRDIAISGTGDGDSWPVLNDVMDGKNGTENSNNTDVMGDQNGTKNGTTENISTNSGGNVEAVKEDDHQNHTIIILIVVIILIIVLISIWKFVRFIGERRSRSYTHLDQNNYDSDIIEDNNNNKDIELDDL